MSDFKALEAGMPQRCAVCGQKIQYEDSWTFKYCNLFCEEHEPDDEI